MCHFVTLVAPTEDIAAVRAVMLDHSRDAQRVEGRSLALVLRPGERQYLTCRAGCDCGTALATCEPASDADEARDAVKLARKGWSPARIDRVLADRRKAKARPTRGSDSLEFWARVISDLSGRLSLSHVGLFLHDYRGSVVDEVFEVVRVDAPVGLPPTEALATMGEDRLMIFRA
jgi:hypothetical protein